MSASTEVVGQVFTSKPRHKSHVPKNGTRTRERAGSTDVSAGLPQRDAERASFHTTVHGRQSSGARDSGRSLSTHERKNGFSPAPMPPSQFLSRGSSRDSGEVEITDDFVHDLLADNSSGSTGDDSPRRAAALPPSTSHAAGKARHRTTREMRRPADDALLRNGGIRTRDPTSPTGTVPIYEVLLELLQLERSTSLKDLERHVTARIDRLDERLQEFRVGDDVLDTLAQARQSYKDLVEFFHSAFGNVMRMEREMDARALSMAEASATMAVGLRGHEDRMQSLERAIASAQGQVGALQEDISEVKKNQQTLLELARSTQAQNSAILRALDASAAREDATRPPPRTTSSGKGHRKSGSGLSFAADVVDARDEEWPPAPPSSARSPRDSLKKKMSTNNMSSLRARVEGHYAVDKTSAGSKVSKGAGSARIPRSRRQRSSTAGLPHEAPSPSTGNVVPSLNFSSMKKNDERPASARQSPTSSPKEISDMLGQFPQTARASPRKSGSRDDSGQRPPLFNDEDSVEQGSEAYDNIFRNAPVSPSFAQAIQDAAEVADGTMVWGRDGERVPVSIIYTQAHDSPMSSGSPSSTNRKRAQRITSSSSSEK